MHLKKVIMMGAAAILFASSLLNVSAAELSAGNYAEALKENEKKDLIINVEAYKAAYSDLAEAFGDDENAYIEHYLTIGVFEGRTKGVLFDPLAYAEAYEDVKAAFGNDISAIVNHYITFGVAENRTLGTANGYEDIATAEKNGSPKITVQRNIYSANATDSTDTTVGTNTTVIDHETNAFGTDKNNIAANSNNLGSNIIETANNSMAASSGSMATGNASLSADNSSVNTGNSNNPVTPSNTNTTVNTGSDNNSAPAGSTDNSPVNTDANTGNDNNSAPASGTDDSKNYHHTTSIYADESTLLRVEYYDENNKLFEYSDVTNYDKNTNSYTETVYRYDDEKQVEVATRTDTYVNGELVSSEKH